MPARVGRRMELLDAAASTNQVALARAMEPDADGLAILAEQQSAGRGRLGRSWSSPRGASVLCSVLLIDDATDVEIQSLGGRLTLAAAVGACEAIRRAVQVAPTIKWPNDLLARGRKLAGILVESRRLQENRFAWVVGIGINCLQHEGHFPAELRDRAVSLDMLCDQPIERAVVARELLKHWDAAFAPEALTDGARIRDTWTHWAEPLGTRVHLRCDGRVVRGRTMDVDPVGGLIVQTDTGGREWLDPLRATVVETAHETS